MVHKYAASLHAHEGTLGTQRDGADVIVITDAGKNEFGTGCCFTRCFGCTSTVLSDKS